MSPPPHKLILTCHHHNHTHLSTLPCTPEELEANITAQHRSEELLELQETLSWPPLSSLCPDSYIPEVRAHLTVNSTASLSSLLSSSLLSPSLLSLSLPHSSPFHSLTPLPLDPHSLSASLWSTSCAWTISPLQRGRFCAAVPSTCWMLGPGPALTCLCSS